MSDIVNEEQSEYWNDNAGPRWVTYQEQLDAQIESCGLAGMDAADIANGESILDIGCGCGATTLELARRVGSEGRVLGADLSSPMLARARERAKEAGLDQASFAQGDAQVFPFEQGSFDLVFSRFGVMFFSDPPAAFANLRAALKPGGRLCVVVWRAPQENAWVAVPMMAAAQHLEMPAPPEPGAPGPFAMQDAERTREILSEAGFEDIQVDPLDQVSSMGGETVEESLEFLQKIGPLATLLDETDEATRATVLDAVAEALQQFVTDEGLRLPRAMWIVSGRNPG